MEDIRPLLLDLLQRAYQSTLAYFATLPASELEDSGRPDEWQPKDTLAHIVEWQAITSYRLASARQGETPATYSDVDVKNNEIFLQYRSFAYLDILVHADEIVADITDQISTFPLEDLLNPERYSWLSGQPLFWRVAHSLYFHPNFHLAQLELKHGDRTSADERMLRTIQDMLALDDSPRWQGLYLYNLACYYMIPNDMENALASLGRAFALRPELVDWSKSDSRLVGLHNHSGYHELVSH